MPYIDRDVYEALAGTKAGGRVLDRVARTIPNMRMADANLFVSRVAKALFTGLPNTESLSALGRATKDDIKRRLAWIVTKGEGDQ